jgi:hypothetical protein
MKLLCLLLLALSPLFAQNETYQLGVYQYPNGASGTIATDYVDSSIPYDQAVTQYTWTVARDVDGNKTIIFSAYRCDYSAPREIHYDPQDFSKVLIEPAENLGCDTLSYSQALLLGPIQSAFNWFYSLAPGQVAHNIDYIPNDYFKYLPPQFAPYKHDTGAAPRPRLTVAQPATQVDPEMIFLDGLSYNIVEYDVMTDTITSQVTLPPQARVFALQPTIMGPENTVWTAHAGTVNEISICDLATQSVVATIPTPSLNPDNTVPVGLVFTSGGEAALYAVSYYTPDSSGNNGTLLVFDAASQTLAYTLPLKYAPTALLMAPDGLTAYLLSNTGMITYFDVLSGTADLTASTDTPGMENGYAGVNSDVFIHPDGTRLFWNVATQLEVFDLTTRQVINSFNSGLPATSTSMQMSQDGSTIWFANALGNIVIFDTQSGGILGTYQVPESSVYPGPAY